MSKTEAKGHSYYALVEYWFGAPFAVHEDCAYNGPENYWNTVGHKEYLSLKREGFVVAKNIDVDPKTGKKRPCQPKHAKYASRK